MNNGDGRTEAQDLDALFPGLTRKPAAGPRLVDPVRVLDPTSPVDPTHPGDGRHLAFLSAELFQLANGVASRTLGAYWADPRRMFWTPLLAGAAVRLWELEPELFSPYHRKSARILVGFLLHSPMDEVSRMALVEMAQAGVPILRDRCLEARALAELGLDPEMSLVDRVEAVKARFATTPQAVEWLTVNLPTALVVEGRGMERLLLAEGPYRELGECFAALAERQGIRTWEEALTGAISYWRDARGSAFLEMLIRQAPVRVEPVRKETRLPLRTTASDTHRQLLKKLATQLGRAKKEIEETRTLGDARLARVSTLERELADAKRGRDRAAERLRKVEVENAELRKAVAAAAAAEPEPAQPGSEPPISAFYRAPAAARSGEAGSETSVSGPSVPAFYRTPPAPPSPETVLAGRHVYLYTGVERAGAREAMAGALEHHGAICEAFDGNRFGLLGPERFPTDALVVIETSHLCHSASELIEARARASGAWFYVGAAGSGALARRVAERWWRTHRG